jgi:hypothetical protein
MAAGVADRLLKLPILSGWEAVEPKAAKRGPYKKKFQTEPLPIAAFALTNE